jgi:hypothetical protein
MAIALILSLIVNLLFVVYALRSNRMILQEQRTVGHMISAHVDTQETIDDVMARLDKLEAKRASRKKAA